MCKFPRHEAITPKPLGRKLFRIHYNPNNAQAKRIVHSLGAHIPRILQKDLVTLMSRFPNRGVTKLRAWSLGGNSFNFDETKTSGCASTRRIRRAGLYRNWTDIHGDIWEMRKITVSGGPTGESVGGLTSSQQQDSGRLCGVGL